MCQTEDDFQIKFPWKGRTYRPYTEVEPWLREHVGEFDQEWYRLGTDIAMGIVAGAPLYDYYHFRNEKAAMLFQLRWGG